MVHCELECGARFHACKQHDHLALCRNQPVACPNAGYGCPTRVRRSQMRSHLGRCPASVVQCKMEWSRLRVCPNARENLSDRPLRLLTKSDREDLDIALTLRDQRMLSESVQASVEAREILAKSSDEIYPAVPLPDSASKGQSLEDKLIELDYIFQTKKSDCASYWHSKDSVPCYKKRWHPKATESDLHQSEPTEGSKLHDGIGEEIKEERTDLVPALFVGRQPLRSDLKIVMMRKMTPGDSSREVQGCGVDSVPASTSSSTSTVPGSLDLDVRARSPSTEKANCTLMFRCAQDFRLDEFGSHFKFVHDEVHTGLHGWLVQRCPLAIYGCTYSQHQRYPNQEYNRVVYNQPLESFTFKRVEDIFKDTAQIEKMSASTKDSKGQTSALPKDNSPSGETDRRSTARPRVHRSLSWEPDYLSLLPVELLRYLTWFLDPFTLNFLAQASRRLRLVCCSVLEERGMVVPQWEKMDGRWRVAKEVWQFSTAVSPVRKWCSTDPNRMTAHLANCPYNVTHQHTEPRVRLVMRGRRLPPLWGRKQGEYENLEYPFWDE
ncbi:F-box only protein 30-like [Patiria miniata]|uniref:F-box only protein 30 n=1 Tax=Patiria miniata TaxID=46514 RepID=A0A913ZQA8_PATMI|nr:F-box only protein 30-like [Patiria miniata]